MFHTPMMKKSGIRGLDGSLAGSAAYVDCVAMEIVGVAQAACSRIAGKRSAGMTDASHLPERLPQIAGAIRDPSNPNHFMVARPVAQRLRIFLGARMLAETKNALCLIEVGRKAHDPVYHVPPEDLRVPLDKTDRTTHCPLKGDASYFALGGEEVGWAYLAPFEFAAVLAGLHAFWASKVRIELGG